MNRRIRHWKQRYEATAEMVFKKSLLINGKEVKVGDKLSTEFKNQLGMHRLKMWWLSGAIEMAEMTPIANPETPVSRIPVPLPKAEAPKVEAPKAKSLWTKKKKKPTPKWDS